MQQCSKQEMGTVMHNLTNLWTVLTAAKIILRIIHSVNKVKFPFSKIFLLHFLHTYKKSKPKALQHQTRENPLNKDHMTITKFVYNILKPKLKKRPFTCKASIKAFVPLLAMVPKLLTRSALVMPIPVSMIVKVLSSLLGISSILRSLVLSSFVGSVKLS